MEIIIVALYGLLIGATLVRLAVAIKVIVYPSKVSLPLSPFPPYVHVLASDGGTLCRFPTDVI